VNDLPERVHTGIGATRHNGRQGSPRKRRKRTFERVLDSLAVRLRLPAVECGAVVLDA
jgi:hypothetical protein